MAMNLAVVSTTQRDGELIADLAAQRSLLRKAQMVRIRWLSRANQARLLSDVPNVVSIAKPTDLRQAQHVLVDRPLSIACFP
jgi:hypothetical protein